VACLLKARIVKRAETAVASKRIFKNDPVNVTRQLVAAATEAKQKESTVRDIYAWNIRGSMTWSVNHLSEIIYGSSALFLMVSWNSLL
jgi:hypothetical protein